TSRREQTDAVLLSDFVSLSTTSSSEYPALHMPVSNLFDPPAIFFTDIDGDGRADYLVNHITGRVTWRRGLENGLFEEERDLSPTNSYGQLFPLDLDGDGLVELLSQTASATRPTRDARVLTWSGAPTVPFFEFN